jgi:pre-rRNA-processing protein TSR1
VLHLADPAKQESLQEENVPNPLDAEQTWPTDDELQAAEHAQRETMGDEGEDGEGEGGGEGRRGGLVLPPRRVKRVPKGTSSYQAAWIIDSASDDDDDDDNDEEEDEGETEKMRLDKDQRRSSQRAASEQDAAAAGDGDGDGHEDEDEEEEDEEYEEVPVDDDWNALDAQLTEQEEADQLAAYLEAKGTHTHTVTY